MRRRNKITSYKGIDYLKRYYYMLFPKELKENEYVCLFLVKTDSAGNVLLDKDGNEIKFHKYVKNFEQYRECVRKFKHNFHVYNALATVKEDRKGELHRREANMRQRRVLFIDFDKKDYPEYKDVFSFSKMIKDKFPDLFLHAYYDSGHGYHFYVIIPPTCKNREISELNKEICGLVGADTDACKVTQVARVPCTYNRKYLDEKGRFPLVKEIDHYKNNPYTVKHFHPCDVDYIRRRVENAKKLLELELETKPLEKWDYVGDGYDLKVYPCLCTEKVLREGADKGQRNIWLGRIISMLRFNGNTESRVREICLDWNTRCRPPKNPREVRKDIDAYLDKEDIYKLNGCWDKIPDTRVSEAVKSQCDRLHCMQALQKKNISIEEDIGVKMSQKLLTEGRLRNDDKENSLSGYEYLVMTILYKYIKPGTRSPFTVKDLKIKMQYKKNGKWQLCMDIKTFKSTLDSLVRHCCIELVEPTPEQCRKKKVTYDDTRIKMKRGMKELNDRYIEFYYSAARAFIAKQVTQNEFKVFLCIVNNIKEGKSCTMEDISRTMRMGKSHVVEAIGNLKNAQCIDVIQKRSEKGNWFNIYSQKHTDEYNDGTYRDVDIRVDAPDKGVAETSYKKEDSEELITRIIA